MIKLFKTNATAQFFVIIIMMVTMWIGAFLHPVSIQNCNGGAVYCILQWALSDLPLISVILAFIAIGFEGFWLNLILYKRQLVPQNTLLPMFFYILLMSCTATEQTLTPTVVGNALLLWLVDIMMPMGDLPIFSKDRLFALSALAALCTMVQLEMVVLIILIIAIVIYYKLYKGTELIIVLLGLLAPYLMWGVILFLDDALFTELSHLCDFWGIVHLSLGVQNVGSMSFDIVFLLLFLVGIMSGRGYGSHRMRVSEINDNLIIFTLLLGLAMMFWHGMFPIHYQSFAVGGTYVAATFLLNLNNRWYWNLFFTLLLIGLIIHPYIF